MKKAVLVVLCLLMLAGFAISQSMIESATAAAGGSAAGVAGKTVSKGIDGIMTKVGGVTKAAADTGTKEGSRRLASPIPPIPVVTAVGSSGVATPPATPVKRQAAITSKPARTRVVPTTTSDEPAVPSQPVDAAKPPEAPQQPTHNWSAVSAGLSRQELTEQMGKPAGRVTFSGDEGFVEIYKFKEGSVRLINGKVSEVKANQ